MRRSFRFAFIACALVAMASARSPAQTTPSRAHPFETNEQLLEAVGKGDLAATAALLDKGADPNAILSGRGSTALYVAAELKDADMVKLLLDHGADPDTRDLEWGRTPLDLASLPGDNVKTTEATGAMLKHLIDKNAGSEGESLADLIRCGRVDVARTIILRGGVDPSYLNIALQSARRAQQWSLVDLLVKTGAKEPGPIDGSRSRDRLKLMEGVYRSPSGREVTFRVGQQGDQLVLDKGDGTPIALNPLDLMYLRSFDWKLIVRRKAGALPPPALTISENGRGELFTRTSAEVKPVQTARTAPANPARQIERRPAPAPALPSASRTKEWPSFRGPGAAGVMDGVHAPTTWDAEKGVNVKWKTPIPGLAHSSPVVWGDKVFITTAVAKGDASVPFLFGDQSTSVAGSTNRTYTDEIPHTWRVYELDKATGKILWERVAHEGVPRTGRHMNQSQADSTPVTDGTHLVAWFGSEGLYCYDYSGKLLWQRDLGVMRSGYLVDPAWAWNMSSSPIIYKNLLILQADQLKGSYVTAIDVNTGKDVWRVDRDEIPTWATPLIYEGSERTELITAGSSYARAYDPMTGRELWRLGKHSTYAISTPFAANDMVFFASGSGGTIQPIYAVRPGMAEGDITLKDDQSSNDFIIWSNARGAPFLTTPIFYDGILYVCTDNGVVAAYDGQTGQRLYQQRLSSAVGGSHSFAASPVAADGNIYFPSEDGEVIVIKAGPKFERAAVNPMGEPTVASPAISDGMLIFRMQHHVIAVADPSRAR